MRDGENSRPEFPHSLRDRLYKYFCGSGFRNDLAEDLTQDTLLKILLNAKSFRNEANFRTWAYRIAFNTKIDHYRRTAREKYCRYDEGEFDIDKRNPEVLVDREKQYDVLRNCINYLPEAQRIVIQLYVLEEWTYNELALEYCCSKNVLKARVFRAMEKLRGQLASTARTLDG